MEGFTRGVRNGKAGTCKCIYKKDGTRVREHIRTIDSDTQSEESGSSYMDKTPLLQGGISYNETEKTEDLKEVIKKGLQILSLTSQICNEKNNQSVKNLKPQLTEQIKLMDSNLIQMKKDIDNSVSNLVNAKNQEEYSKKYEPVLKKYDEYQKQKFL